MLKKKPVKKPAEKDFTALDAAVSELTKQTEALLGKAEEKPSKPTLPKKRSIPHKKGKSFDIIHNPKSKTKLHASLKTAKVTAHSTSLIEPKDEPTLLPDHAGKSFNELDSAVSEPTDEKPIQIKHHEGSLVPLHEEPEQSAKNAETPSEDETIETASISHTSLSFEEKEVEPEDSTTEQVTEKNTKPEKEEKQQNADEKEESAEEEKAVEKISDDAPAEPAPDLPAYNSGELFANNLVKERKQNGYKPLEDQQKPTVFDTNEYHPELHEDRKSTRLNSSH